MNSFVNTTILSSDYLSIFLFLLLCLLFIFSWKIIISIQKKKNRRIPEVKYGGIPNRDRIEAENQMRLLAAQHVEVVHSGDSDSVVHLYLKAFESLKAVRKTLENASPEILSVIPSARWLCDNFSLIYQKIKSLETGEFHSGNLPLLKIGMYRGYPRIYAICRQIVATEKNIDHYKIISLIESYQSETPLKSSELHALPEMLSLCLLEHIIKISNEIQRLIKIKEEASLFVSQNEEKLMEGHEILSLLKLEKKDQYSVDNVFLSQVLYLMKRLSIDDEKIDRCLLDCPVITEGTANSKDIFFAESHFQANLESMIRSLIGSFTKVRNFNTEKLFDTLSPIEKTFSKDPAGVYSKMDIEARSSYRYVVEGLSRRYKISELKLAEITLSIAKYYNNDNSIYCPNHVGAYLSGRGLNILKAKLKGNPIDKKSITAAPFKKKLYFILMAGLTLAMMLITALLVYTPGCTFSDIGVSIFLLFALFPIIGIAIEITNQLYTRFVPTKILPALDFVNDIPDSFRSFVVMPVIVSSIQQIESYVKQLERHYLSNSQDNLFFSVLGDFEDAPERVMPKDALILKAADDAIAELNLKYPSSIPRFFSFFRYREWNESEGCWMGWERKRGKLEEFNALLSDDNTPTTFIQGVDKNISNTIKYVITLDADTRLIRDSAA